MTQALTARFDTQAALDENRKKLSVILLVPVEKRSTEQTAEVTALQEQHPKLLDNVTAANAAWRAEQEKGVTIIDSEARELRQLTERAPLGEAISATVEQRMTTGETAELQAHYKINSNQIPIEMLRVDRGVEARAAATVPASIGDASQAEVITPVFSTGDGAFLGIERPVVPVGDSSFPLLSTVPSVAGPFTGSDDAAQTDATFVANGLAPERLQASYAYRSSDLARFSSLDSSLRLTLNAGLQEALDKQAISGDDGLLSATNLPNNNVSAVTSFQLYLSGLLYGRVDGRYARTPSDVRAIVGQGTFAHASLAFRGNNSDESAVERLGSRSGGLRVSAHTPDVSGSKQNALIRLGMERGAAVQPTWLAITLLSDPYSRSAQGEVVISAILLSNFAITRTAQWRKQQTQHA